MNLTNDISLIYIDKKLNDGNFFHLNTLPFEVRRIFFVENPSAVRGKHAHFKLKEILIPLKGQFDINVTDGIHIRTTTLNNPQIGFYIPPYLWRTLGSYSTGCLYISLCSEEFDDNDYIHDYEKYKEYIKSIKDGKTSLPV